LHVLSWVKLGHFDSDSALPPHVVNRNVTRAHPPAGLLWTVRQLDKTPKSGAGWNSTGMRSTPSRGPYQLGGAGRLVRGDLLRVFERAAVQHVGRNPGRAKRCLSGRF